MKNKKLKKLNILHTESSPGWGGQEIRILKESEGMKAFGHNVIMAVQKNGGLINQAKLKGFKTYEIRYKKIFWPIYFFKLLYIIKKHNINIINTHSSEDAWLAGFIARIFKIPIIRTRHLSTKIKKGLNSKLLYGFLADFVVTTCFEIVNVIINQAKKDSQKCLSIPTGIDFSSFKINSQKVVEFKKQYNLTEKYFLVGTACFMRSWKGINDLLKAAKILENEKSIKFILIGGGHIKTYLKLAKDMNLKNVIFTGHIENPIDVLSALDIFTLLSTAHEGVSQASLQAAYLGKPLITTSTGGLKEVCINNETGIQVEVFSPYKVAKAILKLKNDEKSRKQFGKNAKKIAMNFSIEKMIKQMHEIYYKLIR